MKNLRQEPGQGYFKIRHVLTVLPEVAITLRLFLSQMFTNQQMTEQ